MKRFSKLLLFVFSLFCSCMGQKDKPLRIGIDPYWFPNEFENQQADVNAYIEDLLQLISRKENQAFSIVTANWDSVKEDLEKGVYEGTISSMPLLPIYKDRFSFSEPLLSIGPVLVVAKANTATNLEDLSGKTVLVIEGSSAFAVLQKYPTIIVRTVTTLPQALNEVANGSVTAAVLPGIFARNYVRDLYADSLKIVGKPLTEEALRLITRKDSYLMKVFSKGLEKIKPEELEALQKKWTL